MWELPLQGTAVGVSFHLSYAAEEDCDPAVKRLWDGETLPEGIVATITLPSQDWSCPAPQDPQRSHLTCSNGKNQRCL